MQVNRVNNNTNNVNFKAKPVVQISEEFIQHIGTQKPLTCALLADELAAILRVFNRAAGNIGQDTDTLTLQSVQNFMFEIVPNNANRKEDKFPVYFFGGQIPPMTQMVDCIRALAKKFGDNKKIDLEQLCARPYQDCAYQLEGGKIIRVPFADRPVVRNKPKKLTVKDCLNMIRSLNTKA